MWLIFKKELRELLRDRKTLIFMIALPLLVFPLLAGVGIFFGSNAVEKAQNEVLKFAITGDTALTQIDEKMLAEPEKFERVALQENVDYAELIRTGQLDFVLEIPATYNPDILSAGQHTLNLYFNDAELNLVYQRVAAIVDPISEAFQMQAFNTLKLNEKQQAALLTPLVIERKNVADDREVWGERLGAILPYFLFILCLQGAMAPAADMGAGEKERGTLETLLITPMPRHKLVLGKFLAVCLSGIITALLTVSSMAIWSFVLAQGMAIKFVADLVSSVGVTDFMLMFMMLIPVVAIFSSLLLSLSIYARSFKESQSYMGGLIMIAIFPIVLSMIPGTKLEGVWVWVPLTNVSLAMKELMKGTMDYFALLGIFGSTVIIAGILLAFSVHWFNREKVLFR